MTNAARVLICLSTAALALSCTHRSPNPSARAVDAGSGSHGDVDEGDSSAHRSITCTADPSFAGALDVPEASSAAEIELTPGTREILVLSDSGGEGAALAYKLPSGPARPLKLPLDMRAGDDTEGMAWRGGHLYVLTSSGGVERFSPTKNGELKRDGDAYPIGPEPYACEHKLDDVNCGKNYEGLCLRAPTSSARCVGYAASKRDDTLSCLVFEGDKLKVDRIKPALKLALKPNALSDCAFGSPDGPARGTLLITTNVYGGSTTYIVNEGTAALDAIDVAGTPNNEAILVDEHGTLYQFMDDNGKTSVGLRALCTGW